MAAFWFILCSLGVVAAFVLAYRRPKTPDGALLQAALLALSFIAFTIFLFLGLEAVQP